jgi:hypothetical protein
MTAVAQWISFFVVGLSIGVWLGAWLVERRLLEKARDGRRYACGNRLYEIRFAKGWEDGGEDA